jgi:hypothetical protein
MVIFAGHGHICRTSQFTAARCNKIFIKFCTVRTENIVVSGRACFSWIKCFFNAKNMLLPLVAFFQSGVILYQSPNFLLLRSPGIDSASLCSLASRYDNPISTRFLAPMDCSKIPVTGCSGSKCTTALYVTIFR